jgi:osmoprotectant transport system permease protein
MRWRSSLAASPLLWVGLFFVALVLRMRSLGPLLAWAFPQVHPVIYNRDSFLALFLSHAVIVAVAIGAATIVGVGLAIFATRDRGREFRPIVDALATVGQSFPPAAVLALAVPALGFGALPTEIALFLYGLLPIIANSLAGIEGVPPGVREAGLGMGLSAAQLLWQIELPLAAPAILAGVRVAVTVGIGTATIGSTVGAVTLGTPIFDGLAGNNLPFVLEGAVLIALFAILTDMVLARLESRLRRAG